jgi:hypothetical protein
MSRCVERATRIVLTVVSVAGLATLSSATSEFTCRRPASVDEEAFCILVNDQSGTCAGLAGLPAARECVRELLRDAWNRPYGPRGR